MKLSTIIIYFLLFLMACVTPYEIKTDFQEALVVEGLITDQPGPYLVKISKTSPINNQLDFTNWVVNAAVTIQNDLGESEELIQKSPGNYYTKDFQGLVGRTYWITITTSDGNGYQSTPEKLLPVGDFSNLRYQFVQNEQADYFYQQLHSSNGFNVYLDTEVLPEQSGRVWWRWTGTYQILTYPSLHRKGVPLASSVPDPLPCSGFIVVKGAITQVKDCTCCDCWISQYSSVPVISNPKFINANEINNVNVAFIEANVRTFYKKYYLEVEQLSVSQAVYDFWKIIQVQKQNSSTLFQTSAPKTSTNLSSGLPEAIPVIGYFAASAVKKHSIVINREDIPYHVWGIDTLATNCTQAYKNSVNTKPPFW